MKKSVSAILVAALWLVLTAMAWFLPARETSVAERRPLAQMPQADVKDVLNGSFMDEFEDYALDQFPLRDSFRQIKSLFHYYVLGQKDNNGIYLYQGYAAKQEYPVCDPCPGAVSISVREISDGVGCVYGGGAGQRLLPGGTGRTAVHGL